MVRILAVGLIGLLASSTAFASTNGGAAGAFARVGAGARALAMGNAYTGFGQGTSALFFNPGALPFQSNPQFSVSASKMDLDRSLQYLSFVAPVRPKAGPEKKVVNAGIGVGWVHAGVSNIDSRDFDGNPLEEIEMSSNLFMLGFGVQFHEKFGGGIAAKVAYETFGKITDNDRSVNGDGFGVDAGLFARPVEHLTVGAQIKDIGTKTTWNTTDYWNQGTSKADEWPLQYRVGGAYNYQAFTGAMDIEGSEEGETKLHAGMEAQTDISDKQSIAGRVGLDDENLNFGFGVGFAFWKVHSMIDVTYTIESVTPDNTATLGWGVEF